MKTRSGINLKEQPSLKKETNKCQKMYDKLYETFNENVYSIYDGTFFDQIAIENKSKKNFIKNIDIKDLLHLTKSLKQIKKEYSKNAPSIVDLLKKEIPIQEKQKLLETIFKMNNSPLLSSSYKLNLKTLQTTLSNDEDPCLLEIESKIKNSGTYKNESYRIQILKSNMPFENKVLAYKKLEIMNIYEETDTSEYAKYKAWIDILLNYPWENPIYKPLSIKNVRDVLDENLSFLENPKDQILNIVSQMIRNPNININAIGLSGTKGIGKCHGFDTGILMYSGLIKKVQDIQVGELLMGDNNTPRTVLSLASGQDDIYTVNTDLGDNYTVNSEHVLCLVYTSDSELIQELDENPQTYPCNFTENKVVLITVKEYLQLPSTIKSKLKGYSKRVQFDSRLLRIDPYQMGLICANDSMTIPYNYKCNSIEIRLQFLAGVLDAIGQYNDTLHLFVIHHSKINVLKDIVFICKSLGFESNFSGYNQIYIRGYLSEIPTEKQFNVQDTVKNKNFVLSNIEISYLEYTNYYGFELDDNHMYLLDSFTVTHNTSVASSIAKALNRPFKMISLGGESDASILNGHNFTYVGSKPGRLIEMMIECGSTSNVILLDELDKISETEHGKDIIGTLIHLTDPSTNTKFNTDKYFSGMTFDLSKNIFIFTYNDPTKINKILADRLYKIHLQNYNFKEKLEIVEKHIVKDLLLNYNMINCNFEFPKETLEYIIKSSDNHSGLREIKQKIGIILSRINNLLLTNESDNIIRLKYKSLYNYYTTNKIIQKQHVDILLDESISIETESEVPFGMYM